MARQELLSCTHKWRDMRWHMAEAISIPSMIHARLIPRRWTLASHDKLAAEGVQRVSFKAGTEAASMGQYRRGWRNQVLLFSGLLRTVFQILWTYPTISCSMSLC